MVVEELMSTEVAVELVSQSNSLQMRLVIVGAGSAWASMGT
jgi:hypothetical protein